MEALNIYLQMKLTKEKKHIVTEVVESPNEMGRVPLFDIAFDKVEWDITEENIEKHREDIDTFGAVAVYAMYDNGDFECCVIADGDVADMLYDAIPFIKRHKSEKVDVFISSEFKVYGTSKEYFELGQELGQALNAYTGADEFCYIWNLNTDIIVRVKMSGHTDIFAINKKGYYDDCCLSEKQFKELIRQKKKKREQPPIQTTS